MVKKQKKSKENGAIGNINLKHPMRDALKGYATAKAVFYITIKKVYF